MKNINDDENIENLHDIFNGKTETPSGKTFIFLFKNPAFNFLINKRKLSYRELLFVTTTMMTMMDEKIIALEKENRAWNKIGNTILFSFFSN